MSKSTTPSERIYLDTSVLLSYIQHWVEENEHVERTVNDGWDLHTGKTVYEELETRRLVRTRIYASLVQKSRKQSDGGDAILETAEMTDLDRISPSPTRNDHYHLQNLTQRFSNLSPGDVTTINDDELEYDSEVDNPFFFREYRAEANARERGIKSDLTLCEENYSTDLKNRINDEIENEQDSKVLAEAVKWRYEYTSDQPDKVVTLDEGDMHGKETEINEVIEKQQSPHATLDIRLPKELAK